MSYIPLRHTDERQQTRQEIELDGVRFRLWATHVALLDRWVLDIRDLDDQLVVGGIKVVGGINLILPYRHLASVPPGVLYAFQADRLEPTFATLDTSGRLHYAEVVS